jgi:folate-binding Fe-S cluster repair protein YgfZ
MCWVLFFVNFCTSARKILKPEYRVKGEEAASFLQGLMTNDMSELEAAPSSSLYAMFLNTGGRQESRPCSPI